MPAIPVPAAPATADAIDRRSARVDADWGTYSPGTEIAHARGNAVLTYQGMVLHADELEANLRTRNVHLQGHVVIDTGTRTVRGDMLDFNLRTRQWSFSGGTAVLFPPRLRSPVFVSGDAFHGVPRLVTGGPGSFTTCDLPEPHYHIEGRRIELIPNDRVVIHHARLFIGRHPTLGLARLVIPLGPHRYNVVPQVGQNNIDGAFVKTAYHYPVQEGGVGTARVDVMSRRGLGIGMDRPYRLLGGGGQIVLYTIAAGGSGRGKEWTGSLKHSQPLGPYLLNLTSDIRSNSSQFSPGTTSQSHALGLARTTARAATRLDARLDETSGVYGGFTRQSLALDQTRTWRDIAAHANLNLFDSRSTGSNEQELSSLFTVDRKLKAFDLGLGYNRTDVLRSSNGLGAVGVERLPEVSLNTDRHRLHSGLFRYLPGTLGLAVGDYREEPGAVESLRFLIDLGMDPRTYRFGASTLNLSADFKQFIYRTDSAQYAPTVTANVDTRITPRDRWATRYLLLDPKGYTPFRFDSLGRYNFLTTDFVHRERRLQAAVGSGRDFRGGQFAWQDARVRLLYTPTDRVRIGASSAYDLNVGKWRDVVSDSRLIFGGGFLNLGVRYSTTAGRVGTLRWNFFTPVTRRYSVQTFGGWNGFAKRYDYRVLRLNWEHHDFRLSLSFVEQVGYRTERGVHLTLQLRAFPMAQETAIGQYGQAIDTTDVGDVF